MMGKSKSTAYGRFETGGRIEPAKPRRGDKTPQEGPTAKQENGLFSTFNDQDQSRKIS
jgi:hypothetical protein